MQKIRYEVDPYNRLAVDSSGRESGLAEFRRVLDGRFKTDQANNLTYLVKAPLSQGENIPNQIKLAGSWSLMSDHKLCLTLDKSARKTFGDRIILQGEILDVDDNSILFAVNTKTKDGASSTYALNLSGSWKADRYNRLTFCVKREGGTGDVLTFNGAWEVDKHHRLTYQYERARLATKKKDVHTLTFDGYWDIKDALRLSYVLSEATDSAFEFRAGAGVFREGYIKYEIGIGAAGRQTPETRAVTLSGTWNLKKNTGLTFDVKYDGRKTRAIVFGADARISGNDTVSFRLRSGFGNKDIGASLELRRKLLKGDAEAFLSACASRRESAVYAGAAWKW